MENNEISTVEDSEMRDLTDGVESVDSFSFGFC